MKLEKILLEIAKDNRGNIAVELVIVIPALLLLLFTALDISRYLQAWQHADFVAASIADHLAEQSALSVSSLTQVSSTLSAQIDPLAFERSASVLLVQSGAGTRNQTAFAASWQEGVVSCPAPVVFEFSDMATSSLQQILYVNFCLIPKKSFFLSTVLSSMLPQITVQAFSHTKPFRIQLDSDGSDA